jgi:hypothetical protein
MDNFVTKFSNGKALLMNASKEGGLHYITLPSLYFSFQQMWSKLGTLL